MASQVYVEYGDANNIIKHILKTVTERCKIEAIQNKVMVPINDQEARISFYTGLPNSFVTNLLSETPRMSTLDLPSRILVLETMKSVYTQDLIPSYIVIFEMATNNGQLKTNEDQVVLDLDVFMKEMEILGYQWKETIHNIKIVIEDPEIRFERFLYLSKLKKFRNDTMKWDIVYVDERVVNDAQEFRKPWLAPVSSKALQDLEESVLYHAVSKNGFITGMFSNQLSENDFVKWFTDILMMHLESPSIIILDSNPMHCCPQNRCYITKYHSKMDMLRWLTNNSIPCSTNMSKPALYDLIKKCNQDKMEFKIDSIIRSHGHEVLRLPRHLYDLSITTLLWKNIVESDSLGVTNKLIHLQNKLMSILTSIPLSEWDEYEQTIVKQERELYNIEITMEKFSDKYELKLN